MRELVWLDFEVPMEESLLILTRNWQFYFLWREVKRAAQSRDDGTVMEQ